MLVATYISIKYRPYCVLSTPEREIAMELHRKSIVGEVMSREDTKKYTSYSMRRHTYKLAKLILLFSILIHLFIFFQNGWIALSPLYYVSILALLFIFLGNNSPDPYCIRGKSAKDYMTSQDKVYLRYIAVYQKQNSKESLSSSEELLLRDENGYTKFFIFYSWSITFGVALNSILDVVFILNKDLY